jgi:hypothetical protein
MLAATSADPYPFDLLWQLPLVVLVGILGLVVVLVLGLLYCGHENRKETAKRLRELANKRLADRNWEEADVISDSRNPFSGN